MKNLLSTIFIFLILNLGYSQKNYDTNSLISGIDILKLEVSEMMSLKDEYKSNGVDELYSLKYRKQKNHYFYYLKIKYFCILSCIQLILYVSCWNTV